MYTAKDPPSGRPSPRALSAPDGKPRTVALCTVIGASALRSIARPPEKLDDPATAPAVHRVRVMNRSVLDQPTVRELRQALEALAAHRALVGTEDEQDEDNLLSLLHRVRVLSRALLNDERRRAGWTLARWT